MKSFLFLTVLAVWIPSCNPGKKETPDGGPCSYADEFYPAKLVKLEASPDSNTFNGWFEISDPSRTGKDTISYRQITSQSITKEQLQTDNIETGSIYKYVVSHIITGTCNPDIRTIRLEKY